MNDRYGHQVGDEALKSVVNAAKGVFSRANDFIFRVGGEEFVIRSDFEDTDGFFEHLETFRATVQALKIPNADSSLAVVTVSVGGVYCQVLSSYVVSSQVYSEVDELLYRAKSEGKNRVVVGSTTRICDS